MQNAYGLLIGYVTYLFILRDAGITAFGIFSFALSFGMIFSFISDLGINTAHTRMIAAGKDRNEYNNALIFMKIFLTLIYIGVIFLSIFIWTGVLHKGFESPYEYISILFLLPYFIGLPYIQANRAFFTGTMEVAKMSFPAIVESTVRLAAVLVFLHFNVFDFSSLTKMAVLIAASYSISYVVYAVLSFVVGMPWRFRMPHLETIKDYLKFSYPLTGATVAKAVSLNIAQILIQLTTTSYQLGGYASDLRIVLMITGFTTSVTVLILPILTSHFGNSEEYGRTVGLSIKYLAVFITPISLFAVVFASPVLNLWNSNLLPFASALQIMVLGSWFTTMAIPFWTHFNARGRTKVSGALNIFGFVMIVLLDLILIPNQLLGVHLAGLGVNGAAYASLISGILLLVVSAVALGREVRVPLVFESLKGIALSVLLSLPFYYFLHSYYRLPALIVLGLFVVYILVYIGLLRISRTLSAQEMKDVLDMVNVKKMAKYAIDELRKPSQ